MVVRTHASDAAITGGAVDGHVLAEDVVISDLHASDAPLPFQVLGFQSQACKGKHLVVGAEGGMAVDDDVRMQLAAVAEADVLTDDAVGPDFAIGTQLRARMDDRRGMNGRRHGQRSKNMHVTTASLTTSWFTRQVPLARPILPRDLVSSTSMMSVSPGVTGLRHFTSSADMK